MTATEIKVGPNFAQIRINVIEEAVQKNYPITDSTPQWLRMGIHYLESGREVTTDDLDRFDRMGGTDHLDPTLSSDPTQTTIYSLNRR